jgi:flagellar hook-basal body complex protein FliE
MVEALTNAELMLDAVVTIRDKVVEAYQELLRMPV